MPIPVVPVDGLEGTAGNSQGVGVRGTSSDGGSFGFLGGTDPTFSQAAGVYGQSPNQGVMGLATVDFGTGVYGCGTNAGKFGGIGVRGETGSGVGVQGQSFGAGLAGKFIGDVAVTGRVLASGDVAGGRLISNGAASIGGDIAITGDITSVNTIHVNTDVILTGADCAEQFDTAGGRRLEPGTVVVIDDEGALCESLRAYDRKVAGVVSGAGEFRPAIVLDKKRSNADRTSVALIGKVCCKVDAAYAGIDVGDLLTTSPTPGHAMKAADPQKAFGAVIGKALRPLSAGQGLIPILVALQ
jgi:hypothetical protein